MCIISLFRAKFNEVATGIIYYAMNNALVYIIYIMKVLKLKVSSHFRNGDVIVSLLTHNTAIV